MDYADRNQLEETNINHRLMSESTSLEIAQRSIQPITRAFGSDIVTREDVVTEMTITMMNCTECKRKDDK